MLWDQRDETTPKDLLAGVAVMRLPPKAVETMVSVADELAEARDDWWLFGGAAVALHGLPVEIADVDVLMSARDLRSLMSRLGVDADGETPVDRIRSDIWLPWGAAPLGVDFTAGLQVRTHDRWLRIEPATRQTVQLEGHTLYVPSRDELIAILRQFGRPKDLQRADGLGRLG